MIKLTYRIICDICQKECAVENYDCTNDMNWVFPRPTNTHTYQINGIADLCNECAAPIAHAKHEVIQNYIRARGEA
jgi:hypothetical protein